MPFFRVNGALVYFAHVPKCAGTALNRYLQQRFGPLAFHDTSYLSIPARDRWSKSSPQHLPAPIAARLFPKGFFDFTFSVVRHPARRLQSVFSFQKYKEKLIPQRVTFSDWLSQIEQRRRTNPYYLDNHPRPMEQMVPKDAVVFRLEDGLDSVVEWLDRLAGDSTGPRQIPLVNVNLVPKSPLSELELALVQNLYAMDFKRFSY